MGDISFSGGLGPIFGVVIVSSAGAIGGVHCFLFTEGNIIGKALSDYF